ncbi:MAG: 3-hydroxyacyl-CoA dehydrogenase NAD-binding domain-containing protein [Gaiellaceae bacterium]
MAATEFRLSRAGDVALVTIDNGEDATKPTFFGESALRSLEATVAELERGDFSAAVFTGKPGFFAAGADITEFPDITRERAVTGSRAGHELFLRLRVLPFPTVAAINGACLGGGLELALHCGARVIASDVRHVGFPEVFLGLFPAWGGTQLLPRLVGPANAVKVIVANPLRQNKLLKAPDALELGVVDRIAEPGELTDAAIALARETVDRPAPDWSDAETIFRRARTSVDDTVHGAAPAPYVALDLVAGAQHWSLEDGYAREEVAVGELLPGPQAQASLYAFHLVEQRAKRHPAKPTATSREVRKVGIVGAGLMARQIAALFVQRLQVPVLITDVNQEVLDEALAELGDGVSGGTAYEGFADCDLVLEAVFEELGVKQQVFAQLEGVVRDDCILATNTSALSVTDMAADLLHPDRVAGMHFFNPVAVMPLLEVVRASETSDEALATVWAVGEQLRKRPILAHDAPGFVVNRVLTRMTRVIMDAVEHGTPVEHVDEAVMSLGMPMAPSVLLQMVGPRVANHVLERMHDAFPDRFPLSPALAAIADGGEPVVLEDAPRTREQIVEDVLEAVADETHRLLEEGVVAEAADVDTGLLLGAGWPFFLGGITKHLDQIGMSERMFGHTFAEMQAAAPA